MPRIALDPFVTDLDAESAALRAAGPSPRPSCRAAYPYGRSRITRRHVNSSRTGAW